MASLPPALLTFDRPWTLGILLLLAPLVAVMLRAIARSRLRRDRFVEAQALGRMAVSGNEREILWRAGLAVTALALTVIALAGPRWGGGLGSLLPGESPSLVVALDVSQSMLADDLPGGRIGLARDILVQVAEGMPGWKIGLVAFADEAQVFCPLTTDVRAVVTLAQRARPGAELQAGSNLEHGLTAAQQLLGKRPGAVLLLSDGEQLAGDATRAARILKEAGTLLVAVGIGTEVGGKIPSGTDLFGQTIYRTYRGGIVNSHLEVENLTAIAEKAGGRYLDGQGEAAAHRAVQLMTQRWGASAGDEPGVTLYVFPLALALILLIADAAWLARRRLASLGFSKVLQAAMKRSGHLLALAALTQIAWTWPWAGPLQKAADAYSQGDYPAAVGNLQQALQSRPDDPKLLYDLGCSQYQGGDFAGAALSFKKALDRLPQDAKLRSWAHYNLGNALFRQSEQAKDPKPLLKAAAAEYEQVLKRMPDDDDASHNLALVKERLSESKSSAKPDVPKPGNSPAAGGVPEEGPAPDQAEIDATLDALEHDERQRQAESAQDAANRPSSPSDLMRQMMRQGSDPAQPDRKDW